jgi:hypothetical protein
MKISAIRILPVLLLLSFFISCTPNNNANQNTNKENNTAQIAEKKPSAVSDDIDELAKTVKLPVTPEEVLWMPDSTVKVSGSVNSAANRNATDGKRLVAVLKFSEADSQALTSQVEKISPPVNIGVIPEEWFPEELIAQSEIAGDQSLKGKQYDARDFAQPPYVKGRLIKLEQAGYFVLEMTTF